MASPEPVDYTHHEEPTFYSNGPLYNLISDERGSFYRDVHGLTDLIAQLPLQSGILELGSGWDERGALMIQHELRSPQPIVYHRDADNFVDLTAPGVLAPAHNRKYSVVTGLCYLLNALNTINPAQHADYNDLVVALQNVRSVLTEDGAAVFGIYEPAIDRKALEVKFTMVRQPNVFALHRLDPALPAGSTLKYSVDQTVQGPYMTCEFTDISVGDDNYGLSFDIHTGLLTTLWTDTDIRNAAEDAGFADVQFFTVETRLHNGYSEFVTVDCKDDPKRASHVLLLA